jgi:hypothetical protein
MRGLGESEVSFRKPQRWPGAVVMGCRSEAKDAAGGEGAIVMPLGVPHGAQLEEFKEFVEGVGDQVELCEARLAGFRT